MRRARGPLGLLGRILTILLLTVAIEFGASTFLYERAERYTVQEDEARRLSEHLVIARKLMAERPQAERAHLARALSTDRYDLDWRLTPPPAPAVAPDLERTRGQIVAWEPQLVDSALRLRLGSVGRHSAIVGELRLPDGDWLLFRTRAIVHSWDLAIGRMALAFIPAMGLLVIGGLLIRRQLDPLRGLARATEQVGLGGAVAIEEIGTDEVRRLIRAFNAMQHRIHDLIEDRTQALAAVGHDLRTPLARVQLRAEAIEDDTVRSAIARDLGEMEAMLSSLLAFLGGDGDPEQAVPIDLAVMAATIVDDARDRGDDIAYVGPDHAEACVRPIAIRRAIGNLVENGLHYGDRVEVRLGRLATGLEIVVQDDGPGIPPAKMQEVLRPFTRLDGARARNTKGLGLGLAIVAKAVEREGGTLALENVESGGLRVTIRLPPGHRDSPA